MDILSVVGKMLYDTPRYLWDVKVLYRNFHRILCLLWNLNIFNLHFVLTFMPNANSWKMSSNFCQLWRYRVSFQENVLHLWLKCFFEPMPWTFAISPPRTPSRTITRPMNMLWIYIFWISIWHVDDCGALNGLEAREGCPYSPPLHGPTLLCAQKFRSLQKYDYCSFLFFLQHPVIFLKHCTCVNIF